MTWILALIFKPFVALILFGFIALPGKLLFKKYMPESKFKRFLLKPISGPK